MRFAVMLVLAAGIGGLCLVPDLDAVFMERPHPDGLLNPAEPPEVKIVFPDMDGLLKEDRVAVRFKTTNFEIRDGGPHLHFILDNGLVHEHFNPDAPIILKGLPEGTHVLVLFPVTSWHESWKNAEAVAVVRFHIGRETPGILEDLSAPLLIFNMPHGTVEPWEAKWVLFDFIVLSALIAEGDTRLQDCRIRYLLDGVESTAEYQESRFWLNIGPGEHRIGIWLTGPTGRFLPNGRWNWCIRSFRVKQNAPSRSL